MCTFSWVQNAQQYSAAASGPVSLERTNKVIYSKRGAATLEPNPGGGGEVVLDFVFCGQPGLFQSVSWTWKIIMVMRAPPRQALLLLCVCHLGAPQGEVRMCIPFGLAVLHLSFTAYLL